MDSLIRNRCKQHVYTWNKYSIAYHYNHKWNRYALTDSYSESTGSQVSLGMRWHVAKTLSYGATGYSFDSKTGLFTLTGSINTGVSSASYASDDGTTGLRSIYKNLRYTRTNVSGSYRYDSYATPITATKNPNSAKGDFITSLTVITTTTAMPSTYPKDGISGSYWYTYQNYTLGSPYKVTLISAVTDTDKTKYPEDGVLDGYWYVLVS